MQIYTSMGNKICIAVGILDPGLMGIHKIYIAATFLIPEQDFLLSLLKEQCFEMLCLQPCPQLGLINIALARDHMH